MKKEVVFLSLFLFFFSFCFFAVQNTYAYDSEYEFAMDAYIPWRTDATATTTLTVTPLTEDEHDNFFENNASVQVLATSPITGYLEAVSGLVIIDVIGEGITTLTISGFVPGTPFFQYINHFGEYAEVIADEHGAIELTVDLTEPHIIFLQNTKSTYFLTNGEGGGDCEGSGIGVWNQETLTCTLTQDVTETIQVGGEDEGIADGVTLNGGGYTVRNTQNVGTGIYVYNTRNVTVTNANVDHYSVGVGVRESEEVSLLDVHTASYNTGVSVSYSNDVLLLESVVGATNFGLSLWSTNDIVVENTSIAPTTERGMSVSIRSSSNFSFSNITSVNGAVGIHLDESTEGSFTDIEVTVSRTRGPLSINGSEDMHFLHTFNNVTFNDLPLLYLMGRTHDVVDGNGEAAFNVYCVLCSDTVIKNFQFPEYTAGGIRLWKGENVTLADNIFDRPTAPIMLLGSSGTSIHNNSIRSSASLSVPRLLKMTGEEEPTVFYRNTLFSSSPPVHVSTDRDNLILSLPLPLGGNHWTSYDLPEDGCEDVDGDLLCDTPYQAPNTYEGITLIDEHPWVHAGAWEEVVSDNPPLSLPDEGRYEGVRGVDSGGPNPEKGYADLEVFTFKVVYTNAAGIAPDTLGVQVGGSVLAMTLDQESEDPTLHDGDFTNGEQFQATSTFAHGGYTYTFTARSGDVEVVLSERDDASLFSFIAGYSSIAFVPGLQASRLFEKNDGDWFENQLWEPNRDADAQKLSMRSDGTSLNADIYTKVGVAGALSAVLGIGKNIYKSFLEDLEEWKTDEHLIVDYAVLAYDWRLAFEDVLSGGDVEGERLYYDSSHTANAPYMYAELRRLAESSDSGRVVLVGHSMGGLILKKLLADIEDTPGHPYQDLLQKIDVVVLVASPQLGTPKAVGSLLHGIGQNFEPLAKKETLRRIGHDMPSAYTLVPSAEYFEVVHDIDENGDALDHTVLVTGYGRDVTEYDGMRDFLSIDFGESGDDLTIPMKPRTDFLDEANVLHERLDAWVPPDMNDDGRPDFSVVQVAGWGIYETMKGIEYVEAQRAVACPDGLTGTCYEDYLDPRPLFTTDGDGTVVVPSAVAMGRESDEEDRLETWYVNMYEYNKKNIDISHASILESISVRNLLECVLKKEIFNFEFLDLNTENFETSEPYLRIAMHSPVDISIQSTEGRVGSREETEDGVVLSDTDISNSYYIVFGEEKYLGVPVTGEEYTIVLQGAGEGVFTLELTEERDGVVYESKTFRDVPVTNSTQGVLYVASLTDVDALKLDTDSDGVPDTLVYAEEYQEPASFALLAKVIQGLDTNAKRQLLQTLTIAERFADRGYNRIAKHLLSLLEKKVLLFSSEKMPKKIQIPKNDAERIIKIIQEVRNGL